MTTLRTITTPTGTVDCIIPTADDVEVLTVGDRAPYALGWAEVSRVFARGEDQGGRAFVCYYVRTSPTSEMSASLKQGEVVRTVGLCQPLSSAQIDEVERLAGCE